MANCDMEKCPACFFKPWLRRIPALLGERNRGRLGAVAAFLLSSCNSDAVKAGDNQPGTDIAPE